ncbi:MAG TPA: vitamin K epoxide reductase family protein [Patescibacteria group bacterium]|nr:vitamin K epoxide reductase family protein [Patescibacteria group bacterium]
MWKAVKILAVVGIVLAIYLLWEQFFRPPFTVCDINRFINCNAIISGRVAAIFGLPTPLIGLVGYVFIFLSALYKRKKLLLSMTVFGLVFCLWIAYQELFLLHVICPVCLLCQIDMISVFTIALILQKKRGIV